MRRSLGTDDKKEPKAFRVFADRAFGYGIDFRFENGKCRLFDYVERQDMSYDPDAGTVTLVGTNKRVTIVGINIKGLYQLMLDREIGEVTERHEPEHMMQVITSEGDCYIKEIRWESI